MTEASTLAPPFAGFGWKVVLSGGVDNPCHGLGYLLAMAKDTEPMRGYDRIYPKYDQCCIFSHDNALL